MTNQSTIDKLIEMRLSCMADSFRNQLNDPEFNEVPFAWEISQRGQRIFRILKKTSFHM